MFASLRVRSARSQILLTAIFTTGLALSSARADAPASPDASSDPQMQQKIDQLEAQVQALEKAQPAAQPTQAQTMAAIQTDAGSQSKLLSMNPGVAGYDPITGFNITSDDGNFLLHPWILGQFRGVYNDRQSISIFDNGDTGGGTADPKSGSHETDGFEIHNLEIGINGHVLTPTLQYYVMLDVPSTGGGQTLQDAYATYRCSEQSCLGFKAGQFVDPVWHESNVDDGHQLTVDRSLTGALLGGNNGLNNIAERVQGAGVTYQCHDLHGEFDLTDGRNTANTPFYDVSVNGVLPAQNFGMSLRADYKVMGGRDAWNAYNSLSSFDTKADLFFVGGGFEWDEASNFDNLYGTIDATFITKTGWTIYGAVLEDYADWSNGGHFGAQSAIEADAAGSYPNFGAIMQVGYRINPTMEPFFRYDVAVLNSRYANFLAFGHNDPGGNAKATANNHELTAGINYYLFGYRAKVCGDISLLPNGSAIDAPGLGILANQNHSEWVGRLQFQLAL